MSPFLRGMTGQQMGVGRPSLAQMLAPATRPRPTAAGPTMTAAQPLDIAGLRRQVLAQSAAPTAPQSRQALMAKYGLAPTTPAPKPSPMQRLSAALPQAGTPQMAGLGAVGRTMLELSGYQPVATAPSLGQILARSAEAGIGAMEKKQAAEQEAAEKKAAAERQASLDELERRNIESQIAAREKDEQKTFKPGTPFEIQTAEGKRKAYFGANNELIYVGEIIKPEEKKPGMPNIGATRTVPSEDGKYEQVQEFVDLGNGNYGYKDLGGKKPVNAPKKPSIGTSYTVRNDDGTKTESVYTIDGWKTSEPYDPKEPSQTFKDVYSNKSGKRIGSFRADDERLDQYLNNEDYQVINSGQVSGTDEEVLGMGKATQSKLEININDMLVASQQLGEIKQNFEPSMLSVPGIVRRRVAEIKDLFNSSNPEDKAVIEAYTTWKNSAFGYANAVIKAVTGAQMSEPEAQRIMKELPDPRSFKGTPTEYLAAIKVAERKANAALTRAQYFLSNGIQPELVEMADGTNEYFFRDKKGRLVDLSEGSVEYMINETATSLRARFKDEGLTGDALENAIDAEMARIFR